MSWLLPIYGIWPDIFSNLISSRSPHSIASNEGTGGAFSFIKMNMLFKITLSLFISHCRLSFLPKINYSLLYTKRICY